MRYINVQFTYLLTSHTIGLTGYIGRLTLTLTLVRYPIQSDISPLAQWFNALLNQSNYLKFLNTYLNQIYTRSWLRLSNKMCLSAVLLLTKVLTLGSSWSHCCPVSLSIFCCRLKSHFFLLSYPSFWLFSHLYSAPAVTHHFGHYNLS